MAGFLAYIIPVDTGARPNQDLPGQQPGGIWGPGFPYPDQGLPGSQPRPDQGLPGSQPRPDNTLPGNQPYPDQGLPGSQPRPDQGLPPHPSHPIFFPPEGGEPPLGIWGPTDPRPGTGLPGEQPKPEHPIVLPPDLPETIPPEGGQPERPIDWKTGWTQETGWVVIGVPSEGTLVPTPSSRPGAPNAGAKGSVAPPPKKA